MTVKTSMSLTERHHAFIKKKVEDGVFASASAVVAAGVERMIEDEAEREAMLDGLRDELRRRMETPESEYVDLDEGDPFGEARRLIESRR